MRFTQEDSNHGDNYAMNFYSYCGGDPVNYYDPTGYYKQKNGSWWYDYEHGNRPVIGNGQIISMCNFGYVEDPDGGIRNVFWTHRDDKGKDHVYWNYWEVPYELQGKAKKDLGGLFDQFVDEEIPKLTNQDMIFIDSAVINGLSYPQAIDSLKVLREGNGITAKQLKEITGSGGAGAELLELSYRLGQQNMNLAATAYLMDQQSRATFYHALQSYNAWAITAGKTWGSISNSSMGSIPSGKGFNTFNQLKKEIGSPGSGNQWHHIVEQNQITKSGFSPQMIHNTNNIIAVSKTTHQAISGYYSSIQPFTHGKTVRNWLAGQNFSEQYLFGLDVMRMFM